MEDAVKVVEAGDLAGAASKSIVASKNFQIFKLFLTFCSLVLAVNVIRLSGGHDRVRLTLLPLLHKYREQDTPCSPAFSVVTGL